MKTWPPQGGSRSFTQNYLVAMDHFYVSELKAWIQNNPTLNDHQFL